MPLIITPSGQQIDPTKHHFTLAQLLKYSQASPKQVDEWIKRGIILTDKNPGRGKGRQFTFWNVFEAAIAENFSTFLRVNFLEQVMEQVRDKFNEPRTSHKKKTTYFTATFPSECGFDDEGKITAGATKDAYALVFHFWLIKDRNMTKKAIEKDTMNDVQFVPYSKLGTLSPSLVTEGKFKEDFIFPGMTRQIQVIINITLLYQQIAFRIWGEWD